ncbi:hypothetical protein BBBOND_0303810 [Babesia bigemina]|uniref:Uncharacterized protein n=1 Tax=Babesia bigemina TaxID=5866 RepID=A0A061D923_BABBI|nr:hypothetical protein BBBOND_0303810 [Babesia bigemina]CDR96477.1 hypothetical protein BBBOND_0303810 [Babesia bigemina]|eukprot:XP_012768663.1 hypothetical protein BBBOND_0303810 [Babesia bigemina]
MPRWPLVDGYVGKFRVNVSYNTEQQRECVFNICVKSNNFVICPRGSGYSLMHGKKAERPDNRAASRIGQGTIPALARRERLTTTYHGKKSVEWTHAVMEAKSYRDAEGEDMIGYWR